MQRTAAIDVTREEFDDLKNRHDKLSGSMFAHHSAISLLISSATRRRADADKWSDLSFLQFISAREDLMEPIERQSAATTFRAFVEDAHLVRSRLALPKRVRRGLMRRLFG